MELHVSEAETEAKGKGKEGFTMEVDGTRYSKYRY